MPKKVTTESFVLAARKVHGNRYDYCRTEYKAARQKVLISCRIHGEYSQTPNAHLRGQNCPQCGDVGAILERVTLVLSSLLSRAIMLGNQTTQRGEVEGYVM